MLSTSMFRALKSRKLAVTLIVAAAITAPGGEAISAQDKYTLQVPDGLAFADFKGYEEWQDVAVSQTKTGMKLIAANPTMLAAYKDGLPADGKTFPEGSKVAKIEWSFKQNTTSPYFVNVPDKLVSVSFIEKDSKRFPNTHGWAYAKFLYDPASDTFKPEGTGAECGFACHTKVAGVDYIFTRYPKR